MQRETIESPTRTASILLQLASNARADWDYDSAREYVALAREARAGNIRIEMSAISL